MSAQKSSKGENVNVSLQLTLEDWELFKMACKKVGREHEEALREVVVKWAEDVMKSEQLPPG